MSGNDNIILMLLEDLLIPLQVYVRECFDLCIEGVSRDT